MGARAGQRKRHHVAAAGLTEAGWREEWESARLFLTADGEADKPWGNETIRWQPGQGWLEVKLPAPLAHLANRPHGRYRLSCTVEFTYRGDEIAAQAATGAVRYDITFDPARGRWYLDASWRIPAQPAPALEDLRRHPAAATTKAAEDRDGPAATPARPGSPGPSGAAGQHGPSLASPIGTVTAARRRAGPGRPLR